MNATVTHLTPAQTFAADVARDIQVLSAPKQKADGSVEFYSRELGCDVMVDFDSDAELDDFELVEISVKTGPGSRAYTAMGLHFNDVAHAALAREAEAAARARGPQSRDDAAIEAHMDRVAA